jgi:hypothetical protein
MEKHIHLQTKKAVSPIIAYVLLIGIGLTLATITFQLLKTYVPKDAIECPSSVSARITNSSCTLNERNYEIEILIQNNGLFKFSGFYSYYGKDIEKRIAETNLAQYSIETNKYTNMRGENIYLTNPLNPDQEILLKFIIPVSEGEEKMIVELTPFQLEVIKSKTQLAACTQARINQIINC